MLIPIAFESSRGDRTYHWFSPENKESIIGFMSRMTDVQELQQIVPARHFSAHVIISRTRQ
jgi:hypothetical protein